MVTKKTKKLKSDKFWAVNPESWMKAIDEIAKIDVPEIFNDFFKEIIKSNKEKNWILNL